MKTTKLNRKEVNKIAIDLHVFSNPNFYADFMANYTDEVEVFGYNEKQGYFFRHIKVFGSVELRFWIKSKRVAMVRDEKKFITLV